MTTIHLFASVWCTVWAFLRLIDTENILMSLSCCGPFRLSASRLDNSNGHIIQEMSDSVPDMCKVLYLCIMYIVTTALCCVQSRLLHCCLSGSPALYLLSTQLSGQLATPWTLWIIISFNLCWSPQCVNTS